MATQNITLSAPVRNADAFRPTITYPAFEINHSYNAGSKVNYQGNAYEAKITFTSGEVFYAGDWILLGQYSNSYYLPGMYIAEGGKIYECIMEHIAADSFANELPNTWKEIGPNNMPQNDKWTLIDDLMTVPTVTGSSYIITNDGMGTFQYIDSATLPTEDQIGAYLPGRSQLIWKKNTGSLYVKLAFPATYDLAANGLSTEHAKAVFAIQLVE